MDPWTVSAQSKDPVGVLCSPTKASASAVTLNEPDTRATLPLAQDSAFLSHLVDSGQASSKTYGLWAGSVSQEAPQDGLLVIGGYDESRLKSAATTFPMFSDCPTCAVMTAITYDVGGKSTTLFSAATDTLTVHLDPYSSDIQLPAEMLQTLAGAEKAAVWNTTSRHFEFPATALPKGTITITISDMGTPLKDASKPSVATYKTVIPANELYHRPRAYNSAGFLEVDNATVYNMALSNQTSLATIGVLGLPFFTQNYLVVDPDAHAFQLAPAVTTPADPKGADAKVKQVCHVLPGAKPKSQVAALAGATAGSIIGTLLIVALVLYLRKRKQNARGNLHSHSGSEIPVTKSAHPLRDRFMGTSSTESKSLDLPRQNPDPAVIALSDGTTFPSPAAHHSRSIRSTNNDPRRGLAHEVFRKVDVENDGRLLNGRPLGLSETIHSKTSLPRVAAEHDI